MLLEMRKEPACGTCALTLKVNWFLAGKFSFLHLELVNGGILPAARLVQPQWGWYMVP